MKVEYIFCLDIFFCSNSTLASQSSSAIDPSGKEGDMSPDRAGKERCESGCGKLDRVGSWPMKGQEDIHDSPRK